MDCSRSLDRLCRGGDGGIDLEELDEVGHLEELDEIVFHAAEGESTFGRADVFIEGDEGGESGGADEVNFGKIEDEAVPVFGTELGDLGLQDLVFKMRDVWTEDARDNDFVLELSTHISGFSDDHEDSLHEEDVRSDRCRREEGDGCAHGIDRDHGEDGGGDGDALGSGEAFDLNLDTDGDTLGAGASGEGVEIHDIAGVDRGFEIHTIDTGRDPAVAAVAGGFDKGGLVDVGENDAAEDGAVVVGVFGLGEDAEGEAAGAGSVNSRGVWGVRIGGWGRHGQQR